MIDNYFAVIMAGGGGTRLWPLSRLARPKQMVRLVNDRTMFQLAIDRLENLFPPDRILVVTTAEQAPELHDECSQIPWENFLLEPMPRGTASVIGLASVTVRYRDPSGVMAILTADHLIDNIPLFQNLLIAGYTIAQEGFLVTLGIKPIYPATGYGYIQRGQILSEINGITAYKVACFKEKPDLNTACHFLEQGDHDWNSGMFIWRADRIQEEINLWMPDLAHQLNTIDRTWGTDQHQSVFQETWPKIKPITIDYGIMEKANRVAVIPAIGLGWSDIGSWDSLFEVLPRDEQGNIILRARHIGIDTHSSLVCADNSNRLVVTIGVEDLVIVDTEDALLVCKRRDAQKVKQVVDFLKENDLRIFL